MEPKLSKQSEAILARLKKDLDKHLLTEDQFEFLRKAMVLQESVGILGRFIVGGAAFVGAGYALLNFLPKGGQ